jgi:hypothetical protein
MSHRSIEETFQAIKPRGQRGIPDAPTIGVGLSSNGDLSTSLSQAGQQIAQLQAVYQQQAALISANTQAIQGNTSAQSSQSAMGAIGNAASGFLGGGLGFLSPLISGIASLFGGSSTPAPLPIYVPPSPVAIGGTLHNATPNTSQGGILPTAAPAPSGASQTAATPIYVPPATTASVAAAHVATPNTSEVGNASSAAGPLPGSPSQAAAPQVIVNVSAMDSQSFMDRSADIASAVREAMLNLHPINDVVANL